MLTREFTDIPLDESLIGPLSASQIGNEPVAWGVKKEPVVVCADPETQAYIDQFAERFEQESREILNEELNALLDAIQSGSEPASVLHGFLAYGSSSLPRIAGYLGFPVSEVKPRIEALGFLGVLKLDRRDQYDGEQYIVDPNAAILASVA